MYYDIREVGYEFILAEEFYMEGDLENALKHYKSAIANYEHADNEHLLSTDSPYSIVKYGKTMSFPSVREIIDASFKRVGDVKSTINSNT